jgi:hypothetical protein
MMTWLHFYANEGACLLTLCQRFRISTANSKAQSDLHLAAATILKKAEYSFPTPNEKSVKILTP